MTTAPFSTATPAHVLDVEPPALASTKSTFSKARSLTDSTG